MYAMLELFTKTGVAKDADDGEYYQAQWMWKGSVLTDFAAIVSYLLGQAKLALSGSIWPEALAKPSPEARRDYIIIKVNQTIKETMATVTTSKQRLPFAARIPLFSELLPWWKS